VIEAANAQIAKRRFEVSFLSNLDSNSLHTNIFGIGE
jgi:hypothetical protein